MATYIILVLSLSINWRYYIKANINIFNNNINILLSTLQ